MTLYKCGGNERKKKSLQANVILARSLISSPLNNVVEELYEK